MKQSKLQFLFIALAFSFSACSSSEPAPSRETSGGLDKVKYHIIQAEKYFIADDFQKAETSYLRALELDPGNPAASAGKVASTLKLVYVEGNPESLRAPVKEEAFTTLSAALEKAQSDEDKRKVLNSYIIAYTTVKDSDWHVKAQDSYEQADDLAGGDALLTEYFMGTADAENFLYSDAISKFNKVVEGNGAYTVQAGEKTELLQKIQRARPNTRLGKEVALIDKITKADVAGLFMMELNLAKLYTQRQSNFDNSFKKPEGQERSTFTEKRIQKAIDVEGHPMALAIKEALEFQVRGLEADSSAKFYPDRSISKAEFAVMLEDVLIKLNPQEKLATKYIGETSPFPDVSPDKWFYNASRVTIERQLLPIGNKVTGEFKPQSPVSGADALLALRVLKDALK